MIFKRSNRILGLDIGSHSVKFVEMEHSNKGAVITNCGYAKIPENNLEYDLSNALKHYLSKHKVRAKKAVIAIPACSTDDITLQLNFEENIPPNISSKELRNLVWLRTADPDSDPYDTIIDCQLLRRTTVNGRSGAEFLFASVRREYIEERIDLVKKIGLTPIAIDVDLFALERLAEYTGQLPKDSYATIIDIGGSKTSIGFYQDGILSFIFDVDQGGRDITKEIADNLGIELSQAEAHKLRETLFQKVPADEFIEVGDADVDELYESDEAATSQASNPLYNDADYENLLPSDLIPKLKPGAVPAQNEVEERSGFSQAGEGGAEGKWRPNPEVANIFGEERHGLYQSLNTCFRAYETDFSDAQLSKIILAGGTSQMTNIADFFIAKFEVPTEIIHYTDTIPILEKSKNLESLKENEPTYAVAAGLALKTAPRVKSSAEPDEKDRSALDKTQTKNRQPTETEWKEEE